MVKFQPFARNATSVRWINTSSSFEELVFIVETTVPLKMKVLQVLKEPFQIPLWGNIGPFDSNSNLEFPAFIGKLLAAEQICRFAIPSFLTVEGLRLLVDQESSTRNLELPPPHFHYLEIAHILSSHVSNLDDIWYDKETNSSAKEETLKWFDHYVNLRVRKIKALTANAIEEEFANTSLLSAFEKRLIAVPLISYPRQSRTLIVEPVASWEKIAANFGFPIEEHLEFLEEKKNEISAAAAYNSDTDP